MRNRTSTPPRRTLACPRFRSGPAPLAAASPGRAVRREHPPRIHVTVVPLAPLARRTRSFSPRGPETHACPERSRRACPEPSQCAQPHPRPRAEHPLIPDPSTELRPGFTPVPRRYRQDGWTPNGAIPVLFVMGATFRTIRKGERRAAGRPPAVAGRIWAEREGLLASLNFLNLFWPRSLRAAFPHPSQASVRGSTPPRESM